MQISDSEGPMYRYMVICHMAYGNLNEKARLRTWLRELSLDGVGVSTGNPTGRD